MNIKAIELTAFAGIVISSVNFAPLPSQDILDNDILTTLLNVQIAHIVLHLSHDTATVTIAVILLHSLFSVLSTSVAHPRIGSAIGKGKLAAADSLNLTLRALILLQNGLSNNFDSRLIMLQVRRRDVQVF